MNSKYKAKPTMYGGRRYASKLEAKRAQQLDLLVKAGEIKSWKPQVRIPLHTGNNKLVGFYVVDFAVTDSDDNSWYEEVKGYETQLWKWKDRHARWEYPDKDIRILRKQDI